MPKKTKDLLLNPEEKKEVSKKFEDRKALYLEWKEKRKVVDQLANNLKFTIQEVAYALREHHGIYTQAARFLGIPREVLYRKVQTTPSLLVLMRQIEKENEDTIEYQLLDQAKSGILPAVIFYLKTKGASRGYSDAAQVNASDVTNAATLITMLQNNRKALEDKSKEIEGEWQVKEQESQVQQS